MGREVANPLTPEMALNLDKLLVLVNIVRHYYGHPMVVSSGYRPPAANSSAGGAPRSAHMTCEAVDIQDRDGRLAAWVLSNLALMEKLGLYIENPAVTKGWVHIQTRKPSSGNRVFNP